MADYPSVLQGKQTRIDPVQGAIVINRASNGNYLLYDLGDGAQDWYDITIIHPFVTQADRDSILSHYAVHKSPVIQFNWTYNGDNQVYVCNYVGRRPTYVWNDGPTWTITTMLLGTF